VYASQTVLANVAEIQMDAEDYALIPAPHTPWKFVVEEFVLAPLLVQVGMIAGKIMAVEGYALLALLVHVFK